MKKIFILFSIMLFGLIGLTQEADTTIFINTVIEEETKEIIVKQSEFITIDTVNFDASGDTLWSDYSDWIETKSTQKTPKVLKVRYIRYRVSNQGIWQKRSKVVKFVTETKPRRRIR